MPAGGLVTAAALQTGLGVAKSISGMKDVKKSKEEMQNLATPFYRVQNEYYQNQALARNAASGAPNQAQQFATKESQRGLGSTLGTMTQVGANPNDVTKIFDAYQQNLGRTSAQAAQEEAKNLQILMEANSSLAGQKTMQWTINEKAPYEAKIKELKDRMAVGKANAWGGLSDAVSGISAGVTAVGNINKDAMKTISGGGVTPESTIKTPTPSVGTFQTMKQPTDVIAHQSTNIPNVNITKPLDTNFAGSTSFAATPIPSWQDTNWAAAPQP